MSNIFHSWIVFYFFVVIGCSSSAIKHQDNEFSNSHDIAFTVSVEEILPSDLRPNLHSVAWARDSNRILLFGGRRGGMHHQVNLGSVFTSAQSNDSIWVIDLADGNFWGVPAPKAYRFQLSSSNMLFCQVEDTLFLAGGFGVDQTDTTQLNHTVDQLTAVQVSSMIKQVVSGNTEDKLLEEIIFSIQDTFVQVTGGEMRYIGNTFYLIMGQNYEGAYNPGKSGEYIGEIRTMEISNHHGNYAIVNKKGIRDKATSTQLHRRDLNVSNSIRNGKPALTAFGGVFTQKGQGWLNPLNLDLDAAGALKITKDSFQQTMNNYDCAVVSIYDAEKGINYNTFLGGISYEQYDSINHRFVVGDHGIPLPFIKTILTLAQFDNGEFQSSVQLPPYQPTLPSYIGAEAIFVPEISLLYAPGLLDLGKFGNSTKLTLGYMYGGIRATAPTASGSNPTYASNSIYRVIFNRDPTN